MEYIPSSAEEISSAIHQSPINTSASTPTNKQPKITAFHNTHISLLTQAGLDISISQATKQRNKNVWQYLQQ